MKARWVQGLVGPSGLKESREIVIHSELVNEDNEETTNRKEYPREK